MNLHPHDGSMPYRPQQVTPTPDVVGAGRFLRGEPSEWFMR